MMVLSIDPANMLKVGPAWIEVEVTSEVDVIPTFRGYAPFIVVRVLKSGLEKGLYIAAKSLSQGLEPLRSANHGRFSGLRLRIRKESQEKMAPYFVEALPP